MPSRSRCKALAPAAPQVQEAAAAEGRLRLPEVWANAGGAALALRDSTAAVQQFTTALRRFHNNHDSKLLWWKARCSQLPFHCSGA
jgi:hypothetical protein